MQAPRSVLGFALALALVSVSLRAEDDWPASVQEGIQQYRSTDDPKQKSPAYITLLMGIEREHTPVAGDENALALALLATEILEEQASTGSWLTAGDFLSDFPHPAVADRLWNVARESSHRGRDHALAALAALRDERVFPILVKELTGDRWQRRVRQLVELGTADSLEALRNARGKREANHEQAFIDNAIRDLELYLRRGWINRFDLDAFAHARLDAQSFVIVAEDENDIYPYYTSGFPYVTSDVAFRTFMIVVRQSIDDLEDLILRPALRRLLAELRDGSLKQAGRLAGETGEAAARNATLFAVAHRLLSEQPFRMPEPWHAAAEEELARIATAGAVADSRLLGRRVDYTRFMPRGRNARDSDAQQYARASHFVSLLQFRSDSPDESLQAILILDVLARNPQLRAQLQQTEQLLSHFFGEPDDPTVRSYESIVRTVLGVPADAALDCSPLLSRADLQARFRTLAARLPPPRIEGGNTPRTAPRNRGLRLLGRRYSRTSHLHQQAMEAGHWPVSGLQVAADLLGSKRATELLAARAGATGPEQKPAMAPDSLLNLEDGALHCLRALFEPEPAAPEFMKSSAWEERTINTALAGWAEVRHVTHRYAKEANFYMGGHRMSARFHGAVDPVPRFYERLALLAARLQADLEQIGLLHATEARRIEAQRLFEEASAADKKGPPYDVGRKKRARADALMQHASRSHYRRLGEFLERLRDLARRQLDKKPQTPADAVFFRKLGKNLKELSFNRSNMIVAWQSMALVCDVATEHQSGQVLQIGTGKPWAIYVAFPFENHTYVCRGGIYTYCERTTSLENRLDDTLWKQVQEVPYGEWMPWLVRQPGLDVGGGLHGEDLTALRNIPPHRHADASDFPPRVSTRYDPTTALLAAPLDSSLVPQAIEIAGAKELHDGVLVFLLRKLVAHAGDPRVREFFVQQLSQVDWPNRVDHARLWYAIEGLRAAGPEHRGDLEKAARIVERMSERVRAHYQRLFED